MKIIAGIPARNDERYLGSLLLCLKQQVDDLIVADRGSTDATVAVAELAGAKVLKLSNVGEGAAIRSLIAEAKAIGADILVLVDANGEYDPADIPKLVEPIMNYDADLVLGSRFIGDCKAENKKKLSFTERLWAKLLNFVANIGATIKVSDAQSGLRALSTYALEMISLKWDTEAVKSEMVADAVKHMIRIQEVGIGIWHD